MTETIGMRLREAREKRHLSLQQVSDTTKLRTHYLQALESDDLSAIPSSAQARGFLRIYAEFLGLNVTEIIPQTPAPSAVAAADEPQTQPHPSDAHELTDAKTSAPGPSVLERARSILGRLATAIPSKSAPADASKSPTGSASAGTNPPESKKKVNS